MPSAPAYIALIHHPVLNKRGEVVTTAVTNLDVHDISRSARTFGVRKFFIVNPLDEQHEIVGDILAHWKSPEAALRHPDRVEALQGVELVKEFADVQNRIALEHGMPAEVILTSARPLKDSHGFEEAKQDFNAPDRKRPVLIVFGTGWGVAETFFPVVDRILAPIYGPEGNEGYNHLSVRAAAAVILSRLYGQ